jgi:two-component system nitrate/nitrite response regulator NarL
MRTEDLIKPRDLSAPAATSTPLTDIDAESVTVLVVEDHALLAQSLVIALNAEGCPARVGTLISPTMLLQQVRTCRPGVVLLDLDLGALGDGLDLVQPLTELGARVLVVSGTTDRVRLAETVERGAVGFLSKTAPFEQLLSTVLDVVAQRPVLSTARRYELMAELRSARAARSKNLAPFKTLTPREQMVLSALAQGQRAETIATAAFLSEATVRSQIRGVLAKLGVKSQLEAVALAWTVGWFPAEPH